MNGEEKTIKSTDYEGKWHVIYWYPLDFTFVCPTEIKGFQELTEEFADDGVAVVGASTDSFFSHKAWFEDRETFPQEITHPVLADTGHQVFRAPNPPFGAVFTYHLRDTLKTRREARQGDLSHLACMTRTRVEDLVALEDGRVVRDEVGIANGLAFDQDADVLVPLLDNMQIKGARSQ